MKRTAKHPIRRLFTFLGDLVMSVAYLSLLAVVLLFIAWIFGETIGFIRGTNDDGTTAIAADSDAASEKPEGTDLCPVYGQAGLFPEADHGYFYDHLSPQDKLLYEMFIDLVNHRDEDYERSIIFCETASDVFNKTSDIMHLMLFDHPEFFFMRGKYRQLSYSREWHQDEDYYLVTYRLAEGDPEEAEQIERFNEAVDRFLEDIDLSAPPVEIELAIHDKLISQVSYDHYAADCHPDDDLAFTAYGALVGTGRDEHKAVCAGYSSAFQYLLTKAGIKNTVACGLAGDCDIKNDCFIKEPGLHQWNLVCLGGEWYNVDCTWDDECLEKSYPASYKYFRADKDAYAYYTHYYFNVTDDEMLRRTPDRSMDFDINGTKYCLLGDTRHEYTAFEMGNVEYFTAMWELLPAADGKEYAFDCGKYLEMNEED
ncbi:MAG: hypothetical protein K6E50_00365 [Lachnospiraceae bacterium]|nr:hypothetical protein [Lachnospiraceae bacterium]